MKRIMKWLPLAAAIAAGMAQAQSLPSPAMREYYEGTAQEKKVADATALIMPPGTVTLNPDGVTYRLLHGPFLNERETGTALCSDQTYRGLEHAPIGRTGILVGSNLVLTTPHGAGYVPGYAIFGLHRTSALAPYPDLEHIPAANVYAVNTIVYNTGGGPTDYMLFSLDPLKPAPSAAPLPLRRSGTWSSRDVLSVIGHPEGLPTKIGDGGYLRAIDSIDSRIDIGAVPIWVGSSGSPAFNLKANVVETLVAAGYIYAAGSTDPAGMPWRLDPANNCMRAPASVPFNASYIPTNVNVSAIASVVSPPPTELQVSPQTEVKHIGLVGGAVTNSSSTFQVALPSSATGPLSFTVAAPSIPGGPTVTLSPAPGSYTLPLGASPLTFTATASATAVTSCQAVDANVTVTPSAGNGFQGVVRHRFEIGMTDYSVTPSGGWNTQQFGPPYATQVLEVRNTRATAQGLTVSSPHAWLLVNGGASASLALNAAGTAGDRANVTIGFNAGVSGFPADGQLGQGSITIAPNQPACSVHNPTSNNNEYYIVRLTPGRETFTTWNDGFGLAPPAPGQTFGAPTTYTFDLSGKPTFTVADVDLSILFAENSSITPAQDAMPRLKVVLEAPNGQTATVWDRQVVPSSYIATAEQSIVRVKLDDQTTPPLGPNLLATFNGLAGKGVWRMHAYTTYSGSSLGTLDVAGGDLIIKRTP